MRNKILDRQLEWNLLEQVWKMWEWYIWSELLMAPTRNSEKSELQMEFEHTTLRDLFGCLATGGCMASDGEMWVFGSSCITQLQSEIRTDSIAHNCITQSPFSISETQPTNHPSVVGWLGGWLAAQVWSQRPTFRPCSPQSLQFLSG